jgi:hypothetical protein
MGKIHIAFQEGFDGQAVRLNIDSQEVYQGTLRTRNQIGLAHSCEFPVSNGKHSVSIEVNGTTSSIDVDVADTSYIGVSLDREGRLQIHVSSEPFRYM